MKFECIHFGLKILIDRAPVPGGWFIIVTYSDLNSRSSFFYPDTEHTWDGKSLEL